MAIKVHESQMHDNDKRCIMKVKKGYPLPLGISEKEEYMNFSIAVPSEKDCVLKLYKKGAKRPKFQVELPEKDSIGELRFVALPKAEVQDLEYHYEIAGETFVDPYAKSVIEEEGEHTRGRVLVNTYDWEGDQPLAIPYQEVIAYSLHVRGFTMHSSSKVKGKGTFQGVIEQIPYLQELGVNQIQCMPVYSFVESKRYKNYWGYGEAFCFAVKNAYASGNSAERELKDMVKACHRAGIEVVLDLPFTNETPKQLIVDCLRYYVMKYHVDGFIVNPHVAPMDCIYTDPLLGKTKILQNKDEFQFTMRRFLKSDEGMVGDVIAKLRQTVKESESCNYIASHNGFTLHDLYSYGVKHNEANGEENQDGPNYNHSWNCGVEGPTENEAVIALRRRQVRNAFFLLLSAQGTPCILAGDEFGNSQKGNNNVYCQDNEIAWLDWNDLEREKELFSYVKGVIALRKKMDILHSGKQLCGLTETNYGVPEISYHGEQAWKVPNRVDSRQLGVYYHNENCEVTDCFIAYNMHWEEKNFALPILLKDRKWYQTITTEEEAGEQKEVLLENQKEITIGARTMMMLVGR